MRRTILIGGLAAVLALPLVAVPDSAEAASCRSRKATGTIVGGLGGALLGNAVSGGGGGAVIGGVGGALVGREVGKSGCRRARPVAYYRNSSSGPTRARAPVAPRYVYYDQYGNPLAAGAAAVPVSYSGGACRMEDRSFYDDRGLMVRRAVQVC